ncbi:MAG: hypothetical protein EZS28_042971, partial [Streblomastix strix]
MGAIISRGNRPRDYNVVGGLLGLGDYILLEILSDFKVVSDSIQFIGTCKKTLQLKNHPRFYQIIETLNYPIQIDNPNPSNIHFTDIDEVQKEISTRITKFNSVTIMQILDDGIWQLEATFDNYCIDDCF